MRLEYSYKNMAFITCFRALIYNILAIEQKRKR